MQTEFILLEKMLENFTVPVKSKTNNRRGFPAKHRAMTFGQTRGRFNGLTGLSNHSKRSPEVWAEIKRIGDLVAPFEWKSCHLNKNVVCPKHKDSKNATLTCIISFGSYTGCDLMIEGEKQNTFYTSLVFNGAEKEHWNTDDLQGTKYSLVFF
jgi:hypothetical protein